MKEFTHLATIFICLVFGASCSKNENKKYQYLNSELNDNAKITNAELRAINFERYASTAPFSIDTKSDPSFQLRMNRASVRLDAGSIYMLIDVDVWEPHGEIWREHSSKDDRIRDCELVGYKAAEVLADQLECEQRLILVEIQSKTGELNRRKLSIIKQDGPAASSGQ